MKPIHNTNTIIDNNIERDETLESRWRDRRRFPVVESYYHAATLPRSGGSSAKIKGNSFVNISRRYSNGEAHRSFVFEAGAFALIVAIASVAFVQNARELAEFLRTIRAF